MEGVWEKSNPRSFEREGLEIWGGAFAPYTPGLRRPCVVDAELPQCGATSIKSEEFGESIGLRNSY